MKNAPNKEIRRKSMLGTVLLALGLMAVVGFIATGSDWLAGAAVILCVPAIFMLYRVGRSLS